MYLGSFCPCEVQWVTIYRVMDLHKQRNVCQVVQELHNATPLMV